MPVDELGRAASRIGDEVRVAANVADHAEAALREVGDESGALRARALREGLQAPGVTLVVAGEFQQGKSSLINALLGARVTPTEPLATTRTPIRVSWSERPLWQATTTGEDGAVRRAIDPHQLDALAVADPPLLDGAVVTGMEAAVDHPLLRSGVTLIDTPCVSGGLSTPTAGLVLGLLQDADGLVFVTDASQELTAPELEFLAMARSLCPALVVVLSKTDLYPEWRQILDLNQEHLAPIDRGCVVLPASPQLRSAAVRWSDPDMDRSSGLPLVTWYLGVTLLARARRDAVARCGSALLPALKAAGGIVEDRLAVLDRTTGRHRAGERYAQVSERLEKLRSEAPKRVRLELRTFARAASNDLTNRFAAVTDSVADFVGHVDPADRWTEIEATLHRLTNRALVEHIAYVRGRAETVVADLRQAFDLDADRLPVRLDGTAPAPGVTPDLDDPGFSSDRVTTAHDVLRGAASTGFLGLGVATMVLTGGMAPLALGAGASLSTVVLTLRRSRTRGLDARRAAALQACRGWIADTRAALSGYADDLYKELEFQLESQIETGLQALLAEGEAERARLDALRRVAADKVPEEVVRLQGQAQRLRLVHAHARRLAHRLARPDLDLGDR